MLSILIVEDDITFFLMLTTWLGKKGFVVRSSSSVSTLNGGWGRKRSIWLYRIYACRIVTGSTY